MTPGMPLDERKEEARRCAINEVLPRIAAVWEATAAMLRDGESAAGRLALQTRMTRRGTSIELVVHGQRHLASWLQDVPVLLLNATAHAEDVCRFFPRAELRVPPRVATPNAQVRLVLGGFGKGTLLRHPRKLAELHDLLAVEHLGDELGIITHKAIKTMFADLGARLGHHGAVAGDDTFRFVRRHAVIGAPSAPPAEIAALAAARSGRAVPVERAVQANAPVLLTDGSAVSVPVAQIRSSGRASRACRHLQRRTGPGGAPAAADLTDRGQSRCHLDLRQRGTLRARGLHRILG